MPDLDAAWHFLRRRLGQPRASTQLAVVGPSGTFGDPVAATWVVETLGGAVPGASPLPELAVTRPDRSGPVVVSVPFDVVAWVERRLSLADEEGRPRDGLGRTVFGAADVPGHRMAPVDRVIDHLRRAIEAGARDVGQKFWALDAWPGGAPCALFASHDMDKVHEREPANLAHNAVAVLRPAPDDLRPPTRLTAARRLARSVVRPIPHAGRLGSMIKGEAARHVRSTVFVHVDRRLHRYGARYSLADAEVVRSLRALRQAGVDLALHTGVTYRRDPDQVAHAVRRLQEASGVEITGARSHYLCLDLPELWAGLTGAGLQWDSTVGFTSSIGFRAGTTHPFGVPGHPVLEIPQTAMDFGVLAAAAALGRAPAEILATVVDTVAAHGGVVTLNWHTNVFGFPEVAHVAALYDESVDRALSLGAWSAAGGDIAAWVDAWEDVAVVRTSDGISLRRADRMKHLEMRGRVVAGDPAELATDGIAVEAG